MIGAVCVTTAYSIQNFKFAQRVVLSPYVFFPTSEKNDCVPYYGNIFRRFFAFYSCRYGSRTSSSSSREKSVDDRTISINASRNSPNYRLER